MVRPANRRAVPPALAAPRGVAPPRKTARVFLRRRAFRGTPNGSPQPRRQSLDAPLATCRFQADVEGPVRVKVGVVVLVDELVGPPPLTEDDLVLGRLGALAAGALIVDEAGVGRVDVLVAGLTDAQAEVDIVVRHAEAVVVEAAHLPEH